MKAANTGGCSAANGFLESREPLVKFYLHLSPVDWNNDVTLQHLEVSQLSFYLYRKPLLQSPFGKFLLSQLYKETICILLPFFPFLFKISYTYKNHLHL